MPTDLDQSTGLERLEILGKMQGIDVFDMRPLDASRKGMLIFSWIWFRGLETRDFNGWENRCSKAGTEHSTTRL